VKTGSGKAYKPMAIASKVLSWELVQMDKPYASLRDGGTDTYPLSLHRYWLKAYNPCRKDHYLGTARTRMPKEAPISYG